MRLTSLNQLLEAGTRVDGAWELTPRHQVRYRRRGAEETAVVTADLVAAEPAGLTIQITQSQLDGDVVGRTVTLRGRWQADARNRLTFVVERGRGRSEILTFTGGWQIGPQHELRYRVEQGGTRTLTFAGYWDVDAKRRLTYVLDAGADSTFRFRGAFQTASILAKSGELRYQLGVEATRGRRSQTIALFGTWKVSRDLRVTFEIPYADGRTRAITFEAAYALGAGRTVTATLTSRAGDPLGIEVVFTQAFLKGDGEAFVRLRRSLEETAVEGGVRFRW